MKRLWSVLVLGLAAMAVHAATNDVSFPLLKTAPEKFKGKLITYTESYLNFLTALPPYMEASGFKQNRYLLLEIGDARLPVLIRKKDDVTELISGLKVGTMVTVKGRIREFKIEPRIPMLSRHYVDADSITPVDSGAAPRNATPTLPGMVRPVLNPPVRGGVPPPPVNKAPAPVAAEPPPF